MSLVSENMDAKIVNGNSYFDVRVAAIIVKEGKLLVQKKMSDCYYYLPGGKIEIGEKGESALKREFFEETGLNDLVVKSFRGVVENFYTNKEIKCHSINMYYNCLLKDDSILNSVDRLDGAEKEKMIEYVWIDINGEDFVNLRPICAQNCVLGGDDNFHIVTDLKNISDGKKW